jgi:hypothetical protein
MNEFQGLIRMLGIRHIWLQGAIFKKRGYITKFSLMLLHVTKLRVPVFGLHETSIKTKLRTRRLTSLESQLAIVDLLPLGANANWDASHAQWRRTRLHIRAIQPTTPHTFEGQPDRCHSGRELAKADGGYELARLTTRWCGIYGTFKLVAKT